MAFLEPRMDEMISGRPVVVKQLPDKFSVEQGRIFLLEVESSLKADRPRLVLDCSQVRQLDSAGIQVLLHCLEEAMKRNGDVKLASVPPAAAQILELTKVDSLFEAFDSPADAVNSFYQFPVHAFQPALQPGYPTPASESVA
jgi:anti-sigma B factor antagonist